MNPVRFPRSTLAAASVALAIFSQSALAQTYVEVTPGPNGGTWTKVNEFTDTGSNFGVGASVCKSGIDPALRLTAASSRAGSESGKPNITVYFRSDNVNTDGLHYRWGSVREIVAPR